MYACADTLTTFAGCIILRMGERKVKKILSEGIHNLLLDKNKWVCYEKTLVMRI